MEIRGHSGGRAHKFYSSIRLDVRRIETLKQGADMIGNRTRVKVVKNKVAPPFKQAEFDIIMGRYIQRGSILDLAASKDIINKSGAWYSYGDIRLGQGRENARQFLKENEALRDEIELKVLKNLDWMVPDQINTENQIN